jgi:glycosyltransferase involved in cell wall biosynthesis
MGVELNAANLTVAIITRNEEKAIAKVIGDIRRVVPEAEVLVVDSSSDCTAEIAQELGARVVKQFPPRGYGPAMDTALRSAGGKVVVTLDCDDTYPAEDIPLFARLVLKEGYDIVDGSRLKAKPQAMPWLNYLANFGFALFASLLFLRRVTDLHSGMRAYRKGAARRAEVPAHRRGAAGRTAAAADQDGQAPEGGVHRLPRARRPIDDAAAAERLVDAEANPQSAVHLSQ